MKRFLLIGIFFMLSIVMAGCNMEGDEEKPIFNKTRILVESVEKIKAMDMTYEDFKRKTEDILSDPEYLDDTEIFSLREEDKVYLLRDLEGMSMEELRKIKQRLHINMKDLNLDPDIFEKTIYLSKVYDHPRYEWKLVFDKQVSQWTDEQGKEHEDYIMSQYIFSNENGEWKLITIDRGLFHYFEGKEQNSGKSREEFINSNLPYAKFNGEPIEYIDKFEMNVVGDQ